MENIFSKVSSRLFFLSLFFSCCLADYCDNLNVPPCPNSSPRDLLFLVDGSNSMNQDRFYNQMLDYTKQLFCAFDPSQPNQAGMIVFNQHISVVIPLAQYTRVEWESQISTVRETKNSAFPLCCSCCTPHAEAFLKALEEFETRQINDIRIAFVITDGVPSNNNFNSGGNPSWWYSPSTGLYDPALYSLKNVPESASALKNAGVRLFLVGVPNAEGTPPDQDYFNGRIRAGTPYCVRRDGKDFCRPFPASKFPIVSLPTTQNSFTTKTWDVQTLIKQTVSSLCQLMPTVAPTNSPSTPPTLSPSHKPSTLRPTTQSPSNSPSKQPTKKPTSQAPSVTPTKLPTALPTSRSPTKSPTKLPTLFPTTRNPTKFPTKPPTYSSPTFSPTQFDIEQVDVTFIIDRSESMTWHDPFCDVIINSLTAEEKLILPSSSYNISKSSCWELFMRYAIGQADALTKIPAGLGVKRELGWADDFPSNKDDGLAKGLRVNLVGFACSNQQRTPKCFTYSDDMNGGPITSRKKLIEILDQLRVETLPDGGTCPGLSIEQAVKYVESAPARRYPLQTAILLTDGVFYDGIYPKLAADGLDAYNVLKFSVGIAVGNRNEGLRYGLTNGEIQQQKQQLTAFVNGDSKYFKDLGNDGWESLLQISDIIADELPDYYYKSSREPIPRYTWCGWRRISNCAKDNWRNNNCFWNGLAEQWACEKKI